MIVVSALLIFLAGIACGLVLRPGLDRRRQSPDQIPSWHRLNEEPDIATQSEYSLPRDYYHTADRRQRGTLAEDFGLRRRADDQTEVQADYATTAQAELDLVVPIPRDYYDRVSPDDEGTLSENYGLRRRSEAGDAAAPNPGAG